MTSYYGPLCPDDPTHGRLFTWTPGYRCMHEAHGGNGKWFSFDAALSGQGRPPVLPAPAPSASLWSEPELREAWGK